LCVILFALAPNVCAQEATPPRHTGVPQDWSQHHIVFSRDGLARHPDLIDREPRIRFQQMLRGQGANLGAFRSTGPSPTSVNKSGLNRDWNINLAGRLIPDTFPAKFSFDPSAPPDCVNDYVVFGLAKVETADTPATTANLVAFNNLYSDPVNGGGFCDPPLPAPGLGPQVLFAYNITTVTGGRIVTSPVLSEDGTKIAFVESIPANAGMGIAAQAIFHVLTWAANPSDSRGALGAGGAVLPVSMTSVPFSATANDTTSSPWVDYGVDTAYVGVDNGVVYQIVGVFRSGSTVSGTPWPVSLSPNVHLTSPVLDGHQGLLMVGSLNGFLYQITTSTGALTAQLSVGDTAGGATTPGIVAPPIVDISNGTTFAVSPFGTNSAVLVQADTKTLSPATTQIGEIGIGSTTGTHFKLYEPAFSNAYYNDPSTGVISLCGTGTDIDPMPTGDTSPWQYTFGFTVPGGPGTQPVMNTTGTSTQLSTSLTDRCSGWTEFFNPNSSPATITATSVTLNVLTVTASNNNLTAGEEVVIQGTGEAFLNGQSVTVASLIGSAPTYTGFTASFTTADYANPADTGTVSAPPITATSVATNVLTVTANNSNLTVGEQVYIQGTAEDFLNGQTVVVTGLIGTSPYTGFTANFITADYTNASDTGTVSLPTDFFFFSLTGDCTLLPGGTLVTTGCVVALANTNGTTTTTIAPVTGGASGIIVDNYSSATQASSIYFTAGNVNTAYKFTQSGLK